MSELSLLSSSLKPLPLVLTLQPLGYYWHPLQLILCKAGLGLQSIHGVKLDIQLNLLNTGRIKKGIAFKNIFTKPWRWDACLVTRLCGNITADERYEEVFAASPVLPGRNKASLLPKCPSATFFCMQVRFLWATPTPNPDNTALWQHTSHCVYVFSHLQTI